MRGRLYERRALQQEGFTVMFLAGVLLIIERPPRRTVPPPAAMLKRLLYAGSVDDGLYVVQIEPEWFIYRREYQE